MEDASQATSPPKPRLTLTECNFGDEDAKLLGKLKAERNKREEGQAYRKAALRGRAEADKRAKPTTLVSIKARATNRQKGTASRWTEAPTKEEMAILLETSTQNIADIRRTEDGSKVHITMYDPHVPPQTHIEEEKWDLRVFPMAINGAQKIAFIKLGDMVEEGEDELLPTYLTKTWLENNSSIRIQKGRKWMKPTPDSKHLEHAQGLWLIAKDNLILRKDTPQIIDFEDLHLGELVTTWKQKKENEREPTASSSALPEDDEGQQIHQDDNTAATQGGKSETTTATTPEEAAKEFLSQLHNPSTTTSPASSTNPDTIPTVGQQQNEGADIFNKNKAQASSSQENDIRQAQAGSHSSTSTTTLGKRDAAKQTATKSVLTSPPSSRLRKDSATTNGKITFPPLASTDNPQKTNAATKGCSSHTTNDSTNQ